MTPEETIPKPEERQAPKPPPDNEPITPQPQPRTRRRRTRTTKPSATAIRDQLAGAAKGCAVGVLMMSPNGLSAASNAQVVDAIEQRADKFAAAWAAVAQENQRVAEMLGQLMSGGVWIVAIGQSLAFAAVVSVFAGRPLVPPAVAASFLPEIKPFMVVPTQPESPSAAATDGAKSA